MPNPAVIDAYTRFSIGKAGSGLAYLYVAHTRDSNHLQIGFHTESNDGLNISHIPGPQVHELHVGMFADWLREVKKVRLDAPKETRHHLTSAIGVDLVFRLSQMSHLDLHAGKFAEVMRTLEYNVGDTLAQALIDVRNGVWGNPLDWEMKYVDLGDGRFVWFTYDDAINSIRFGIGYFDEKNGRVYGNPCYVLKKDDLQQWVAWHFYHREKPVEFYGRPPGWPVGLSMHLQGEEKQFFAAELLRLADQVWT